MAKTLLPAVFGILFKENRTQVLLIKRRDIPIWVLPGGGIDPGETPEMAIVREVKEETGLDVEIVRQIAEYTPVHSWTSTSYVYECIPIAGKLCKGEETREVHYFPLHLLPQEIPPPFTSWIKEAIPISSEIIRKKIQGVSRLNLVKFFFTHPIHVIRFILTKMGIGFNSKD
ncbi:MAG: NUDIX domain-containing protein [Chlamydiae bacterium]|nr:NUDIX domain-containing protein [Chlamydiota bacterium]